MEKKIVKVRKNSNKKFISTNRPKKFVSSKKKSKTMDPVKKNKTKSKILLARKKRLRRRRDLLRLVRDIRRFPVVPLIFRRICQLQYLRAYSYKINRIKWVS